MREGGAEPPAASGRDASTAPFPGPPRSPGWGSRASRSHTLLTGRPPDGAERGLGPALPCLSGLLPAGGAGSRLPGPPAAAPAACLWVCPDSPSPSGWRVHGDPRPSAGMALSACYAVLWTGRRPMFSCLLLETGFTRITGCKWCVCPVALVSVAGACTLSSARPRCRPQGLPQLSV